MTPKERAAMQQALEALEAVSTAKERGFGIEYAKGYVDPVIAALREALEQPVKEVELTDDEIDMVLAIVGSDAPFHTKYRAVIAAHKEKNK